MSESSTSVVEDRVWTLREARLALKLPSDDMARRFIGKYAPSARLVGRRWKLDVAELFRCLRARGEEVVG